jgi:hypothetical protein
VSDTARHPSIAHAAYHDLVRALRDEAAARQNKNPAPSEGAGFEPKRAALSGKLVPRRGLRFYQPDLLKLKGNSARSSGFVTRSGLTAGRTFHARS